MSINFMISKNKFRLPKTDFVFLTHYVSMYIYDTNKRKIRRYIDGQYFAIVVMIKESTDNRYFIWFSLLDILNVAASFEKIPPPCHIDDYIPHSCSWKRPLPSLLVLLETPITFSTHAPANVHYLLNSR